MANRSIPNSIPANGRISTRSLRQIKKIKTADSLGTASFDARRSSDYVPYRESEGCLVALAIFKIAVGPYRPR